jgi:hypothetical protein
MNFEKLFTLQFFINYSIDFPFMVVNSSIITNITSILTLKKVKSNR